MLSKHCTILVQRQSEKCPKIMDELNKYSRKRSHWAWWIFPTTRKGNFEPGTKTCVCTPEEYKHVLGNAEKTRWREVLEKIKTLVESNKYQLSKVLPPIDHGRVQFFVDEWRKYQEDAPWLKPVLDSLQKGTEQ